MRLCVTDMIGNYSSLFQFHMQSQMVQINFPSGNNISFVWALIKKRRKKYLKNQDLDQFVLPPPTFPWIQMLQLDTDGIFCQRLKKKNHSLSGPFLHGCNNPEGKINRVTFFCHLPGYLTAAWPWKVLLSSEDEAAILSYPFSPLNTCQKLDRGEKSKCGMRRICWWRIWEN